MESLHDAADRDHLSRQLLDPLPLMERVQERAEAATAQEDRRAQVAKFAVLTAPDLRGEIAMVTG